MRRMWYLFGLFVVVGVFLLSASSGFAEYKFLESHDGVEVQVNYDPLGPSNQIAAYLKFFNKNSYQVKVTVAPIIDCGGDMKKGSQDNFVLFDGDTHEITLWRSSSCGYNKIQNLRIQMDVNRVK